MKYLLAFLLVCGSAVSAQSVYGHRGGSIYQRYVQSYSAPTHRYSQPSYPINGYFYGTPQRGGGSVMTPYGVQYYNFNYGAMNGYYIPW